MNQFGSGTPPEARHRRNDRGRVALHKDAAEAGGYSAAFGESKGLMAGACRQGEAPTRDLSASTARASAAGAFDEDSDCVATEYTYRHPRSTNVGLVARLVTSLAGSWLLLGGLKHFLHRKPLSAIALTAVGGGLVYCGVAGRSGVLGVLNDSSALRHPLDRRGRQKPMSAEFLPGDRRARHRGRTAKLEAEDDEVNQASKESFPASDPPSWSRTTI